MILNRIDWYNSEMILYNIIPQLKYRYLSVRKKNKDPNKKWVLSRYYQGYSIEMLKDSLKRNNVLNDDTAKLYFDLATWKDSNGKTPIFSFNKERRSEEKKKFSNKKGNYLKLINSYDFAIDIDCKNIKRAWKEAGIIKEIFDKYKLPYSLRFSGTKGFHFVIDHKWIILKHNPINLPELFGKVVNNLIETERLKYIDTSIYDARRVLKIAYSLCNNDGIEYVCLPLNDMQFYNFEYDDMQMLKVMVTVKRLFQRGILERDHNQTEKQLKNNVLKFIKEYK